MEQLQFNNSISSSVSSDNETSFENSFVYYIVNDNIL